MKRRKVITLFSIMVFFCLVLSTAVSLFSMRKISEEHTTEFLKVLSNDIYHSVSDELTDTVNNARVVANDSLLIELLAREDQVEQSEIEDKLAAYTALLEKEFSYSWVFIVSEQSKAYYSDTGIYRIIDPVNDADDMWYADFVNMNKDYYVSIGRDNDVPDAWTVFVDSRIEGEDGTFLGICGMALELTNLQEHIRDYEDEYGIQIFFVDQNGETQLGSGSTQDDSGQTQTQMALVKDDQITKEKLGTNTNYTITKYIEPLDWYMVVKNINPYDYTVDYMMIVLNIVIFFVFSGISVVSLYFISKRTKALFTDTYQDDLTGLFNRRAFDESMNELRQRDTLENIRFAVFDVNALKTINDSLGHSAGDELIAATAQLITNVFGAYGKCYRTGGDEFVVILDKPVENMDLLTAEFDSAVSQWHGTQAENLSVSYGISCAAVPNTTVDMLLFLADERMYHKKDQYYNRTQTDRRK